MKEEDKRLVEIYRIPKFDSFFVRADRNGSRYIVNFGGSGSSKSHHIAQTLLLDAIQNPGQDILVVRKTGPALKRTAWNQFLKPILASMHVPHKSNESEMTFTFPDKDDTPGSKISCSSLDDPSKVLSFEATQIWVEEATELTRDDFMILDLRLRKPGPYPRKFYFSYNPSDMYHWTVKDLLFDPRISMGQVSELHLPKPEHLGGPISILHSTYLDNPYLPEDYVTKIESLAALDSDYDRIYRKGLPGQLQGLIYSQWNIIVDEVLDHQLGGHYRPDRYGTDAGTGNPMAVLAIWVRGTDVYLHQLLYQTGMTDMDLVEWCDQTGIDKKVVNYIDPSRTGLIKELQRAGYYAESADNDVQEGIAHVRTLNLHITASSLDLIKEIQGYKRRVTRAGVVLEDPLKVNDHLMDAMRYGIYSEPIQRDSGELIAEEEMSEHNPLKDIFRRYEHQDDEMPGGWV